MNAPGWRSRIQLPNDIRSQYLLVAYVVLGLVGVINLIEQDYNGLAMIACAGCGIWLLERRWFHAAVWSWQVVAGVLQLIGLDVSALFTILFGVVGIVVGVSARPKLRMAGITMPPPLRGEPILPTAPPPAVAMSGNSQTQSSSGIVGVETPAEPAAMRVHTIGRLEILVRGADVTDELIGKPLLAFLWLHLLTRSIKGLGAIGRGPLAEEVSPGLATTQQRRRLRSQLHDLQRKLPQTLAECIKVDGDSVAFDGSAVQLDVAWLRWYDDATRGKTLLDPDLEQRLAAHLEALSTGEFLPGWDDIEQKVNGARGVAGDLVGDVRREVDRLRANLAVALARSYMAAGKAAKAAAPLERISRIATDREDLQRLLVAVYQETGQHARAAQIAADLSAEEA